MTKEMHCIKNGSLSLSLVMPTTLFYLKSKDKINNAVTVGELLSEIVSNI
jgi:hypothetical protein